MAKARPEYEEINEFSVMARQIINKYPENFHGIDIKKVCCVKIINKERSETKHNLWQLEAVKMPIRLHNPYGWYVTVYSSDWDIFDEKHKLLLVAEILCGIPTEIDQEGKVNPFDSKGFRLMQKTLKDIDYLDNPDVPHLLKDEINWVK